MARTDKVLRGSTSILSLTKGKEIASGKFSTCAVNNVSERFLISKLKATSFHSLSYPTCPKSIGPAISPSEMQNDPCTEMAFEMTPKRDSDIDFKKKKKKRCKWLNLICLFQVLFQK